MKREDIVHLQDGRGDCFLGPANAFDRRFRLAERQDPGRLGARLRTFLGRGEAMSKLRRLHARLQGGGTTGQVADEEVLAALHRGLSTGRLVMVCGQPVAPGNSGHGQPLVASLRELSHLAVTVPPKAGAAAGVPAGPAVPPTRPEPAGPVSGWSLEQRIEKVLHRTQDKLPSAMKGEFAALISPEAIAITIGIIVVWAASHGTPVGPTVDIILLLIGIVALGWGVFEAASALYDFIAAIIGAKTERDLDRAAQHLARAISLLGVAAFAALLRKIGRMGRPGSRGKSQDQAPDPPKRQGQTQKSAQSGERKPPASSGPSRTQPTGPLGGKPEGGPKEIPNRASKEVQRGIRRENESADTLAAKGYRVRRLDESTVPGVKNPDLEIEDRTFDVLAPKSDNIEQVRSGISDKVGSGQAKRIVLNLDDTQVTPGDVSSMLARKPKAGLEEVIGIKNGDVFNIFP